MRQAARHAKSQTNFLNSIEVRESRPLEGRGPVGGNREPSASLNRSVPRVSAWWADETQLKPFFARDEAIFTQTCLRSSNIVAAATDQRALTRQVGRHD